ncbi:MAG: hypothetical protein ACP5OU_02150 [Methanothrix sp.]
MQLNKLSIEDDAKGISSCVTKVVLQGGLQLAKGGLAPGQGPASGMSMATIFCMGMAYKCEARNN